MEDLIKRWMHILLVSWYLGGVGLFLFATQRLRAFLTSRQALWLLLRGLITVPRRGA